MILFPEAQEKAHEEIDRVIGDERLPEWEDRENLPYIHCWLPSVPLGTVPHATSRDEEYMGYKIPVGRPNQQCNYVPLYNS
ncbi:uncharacterized protein K441DRAFT_614020 [Cenococcum geophilum 1.58]|uniref:uncharacterized protein n=1 Tax=Cenococcum geophilum 1.58 TaxID=794803 RepID=UPI00358F521F|nr:hypothetical protein K441DRAFT_614020 [Cenococcum geophilum 1.58]